MPYVKNQEQNIYYEVMGDGSPLLMIMGVGGNTSHWSAQIKPLAQKHRLIMYDNRGTGRTPLLNPAYELADIAQDIIHLLDELDIPKTHLLGYSLGGRIAQYFTATHPERVDKLVLVASDAQPTNKIKFIYESVIKLIQEGCSEESRIRYLLPWLFSESFFTDPAHIQIFLTIAKNDPYQQSVESLKAQIATIYEHDTSTILKNIMAQTLIIIGENDLIVPRSSAEQLFNSIKHSNLKTLPDGHCVHVEDADKFNQLVTDFLSK